MASMRKWAGGAALGLALVAGIVAVRTAMFEPVGRTNVPIVKLAEAPEGDGAGAAQRLSQAIRIQTVSHQDPAENQIEQWDALHRWLQTSYPKAHAAMDREVVAGHSLLYRWQGSDPALPAIIMMAHQDVVPVTPGTEKDWKHPPFEGVIADGAVWGRGAVDDKGSLVGLFEALEALAASGFKPKRTIYLVSGHDEEVGGNGAKAIAALLASRGVKAEFTLDEGAVILKNAPVLNGPAVLIGVAEKGYATMKVTAPAAGGHSSMPPEETGVVNLAQAVLAINSSPFPLELKGPGADMLGTLADAKGGMIKAAVANTWLFGGLVKGQAAKTPSGAAMLHTTIAPTMLLGSPKENVLPQSAHALINYRIAPWNSSADVMARAKQAVGKLPVTLEWVEPPREPSRVSSTASRGWTLIAAAARQIEPSAIVTPNLVVGGTDSRNFEGLSSDVYRFMPFVLKLEDTGMIHGTNERVTLENMVRTVRFYAQLIASAAG